MSTANTRAEFVEVLTTPDLVPSSSQTPATFSTVITESSLLESFPLSMLHETVPSGSQSPAHSSTSSSQTSVTYSPAELIQIYDTTFENPQHYHDFAERKLSPWKNTLEFKLFHSHYLHHRTITKTITELRAQAQTLLEQADAMQSHHTRQMVDFEKFIPTITRTDFKKQLFRPSKIYPRPMIPAQILVPSPPQSTSRLRMSDRHIASLRAPARTSFGRTASTRYHCFQCGSPAHIKWYCPDYRCQFCRRISPGHAAKECPDHPSQQHDSSYDPRGYVDVSGFEDGNLDGENWDLWSIVLTLCRLFFLIFLPEPRPLVPYYPYFSSALFFNSLLALVLPMSTPLPIPSLLSHYDPERPYPYPPPMLVKHPILYWDDANLFISVRGMLYGLHQQFFIPHSTFFITILNRIDPCRTAPRGTLPSLPIPFDKLSYLRFEEFITLLYNLNRFYGDEDRWKRIHQLATYWNFRHIQDKALFELQYLRYQELPPLSRQYMLTRTPRHVQRQFQSRWRKQHAIVIEPSDEEDNNDPVVSDD